ncbi:NADH-quinone oxidoreductase subunit L [Streptacidiphilus sp. ASG 303]|uniref:NADH-quinone oxidoreductase subunit 5 family protein n=1 Tax=Streptacidiphilus sp. ASG 303 TaxID=2896847 RepID=UPI001E3FB226|nr:NADH-quinone oxidoreductase subunit L [Streptacidiphilus sp. ASG 303]MCD0482056.1 NADH-quinone oxidoreductase subunit L [Streptacidiphilus sp. ASG 303]
MTVTLAALVPALPALGAAAGLAAGRRAPGFVRPLAVLPVAASAVLALLVALDLGTGRTLDAATRLTPTGGPAIDLAIHLDGLATAIAVLVGTVATCVQVYSTAYLRDDPRYPSYAALVSLFTAAMMLVVYSGDLIVLLVGWEVMGICSYFLIGHHWETADARSASLKAFLVTKLGDVPFLFGLFALGADAGTFRISGVLDAAAHGHLGHPTLVALLLLAGVAGKSAQFPLHTWLPDAMAGPTPVSALIHAATMVAAGIYLVARLLPVFLLSAAALVVLAVLAAVTMVGSGLCALAQDDLKRVLAYSTVGQLGYMAGALASGDRDAAVFHLLGHGFFKALLFLAAGVVIHAAHTNSLTAMSRMPGLRRRVPDASWTMGIGLVALVGLPPLTGFFTKESVLTAAEHAATGEALTRGLGPADAVPAAAGWIVLVAGAVTALLTGAYATRLWLLAFHAPAARPVVSALAPDDAAGGRAAEPHAMRWPLWVLAVPTLAFGVAGLRTDWLPSLLDGGSLRPSSDTAVLGTGLAAAGVLVAYTAWRAASRQVARAQADAANTALERAAAEHAVRPAGTQAAPEETPADLAADLPPARPAGAPPTHEAIDAAIAAAEAVALTPDPARTLLGPLLTPATRGFGLDRLYAAVFAAPTAAAARLARFLDREVVEGYVQGSGLGARLLGAAVRRAQNGNAQAYLGALLAGAVVLAVAVAVGT